jgi:hypothetical protein
MSSSFLYRLLAAPRARRKRLDRRPAAGGKPMADVIGAGFALSGLRPNGMEPGHWRREPAGAISPPPRPLERAIVPLARNLLDPGDLAGVISVTRAGRAGG